jgi:hypothetical protein
VRTYHLGLPCRFICPFSYLDAHVYHPLSAMYASTFNIRQHCASKLPLLHCRHAETKERPSGPRSLWRSRELSRGSRRAALWATERHAYLLEHLKQHIEELGGKACCQSRSDGVIQFALG